MKKKSLYIEVTRDKYELITAVADTVEELAKICGTTKTNVASAISKYDKDGGCRRFRRVDYYDDDY